MLVVFDIDGTLANIEHRLEHIKQKPKNWAAFDAGIPNDKVNLPVKETLEGLRWNGNTIILASGRNERTRDTTVKWLTDNGIWCYCDKLYMRNADDFRSDDIVKQEMLYKIIADYGRKPDMVFDDRPRVVRMWRNNGIFVFNVYQGEEEF